jgi:hypothetical protein
VLVILLCGSAAYPAAAVPASTGLGGPHVMPFDAGLRTAAAPSGAHLTYYGGRVISHVQVVQVIYGTGTYLPETLGSASPSIGDFYAGVTNSPHFDWLTEYNTNLLSQSPRTNQAIGRGSFVGRSTINPSAANDGSQIQDTNIQAELRAQIAAHHLPQPATDLAGNSRTLYAIFFRHGQSICEGGSCSLVPGGFCAYHGTVAAVGGLPELYYSVHPDLVGIRGCGNGTNLQNTTSVASHEMIEAVTDGEVGLATTTAPPLAWYDDAYGEIGDICNGQQAPVMGGDGVTYTVQKEFSNVANDCIVTRGPANDFSLSVDPGSLFLARDTTATATVSTTTTAGSAETVSLSIAGLPSGASATFTPTSVTSGAPATLMIQSGTAAPGASTLTITGATPDATHTATVQLTILGAVGSGIANGGFESGLAGWTSTGSTAAVALPHSGAASAMAGAMVATPGDSALSQTFVAPGGATTLSLWYKMTCPDTFVYDSAMVSLRDNTGRSTATPVPRFCATSPTWVQATAPVVAGHTYTLTLLSHDDDFAADPSYTLFDDVTTS